jgi:hypothetical protein
MTPVKIAIHETKIIILVGQSLKVNIRNKLKQNPVMKRGNAKIILAYWACVVKYNVDQKKMTVLMKQSQPKKSKNM